MPSPHPSSLTLNDGTTVPWLAFGTGTALYSKDVSNIVRAALVHGFTHIDTAQVYQNERSVGEALRAAGIPRENVYVYAMTLLPNRTGRGYLTLRHRFQLSKEQELGLTQREHLQQWA